MLLFLHFVIFLSRSTIAEEPPSMTLNSRFYPEGSEVELMAGSALTLHCHGNWSSSAFLLRGNNLRDTVTVNRLEPRHTGTYRCGPTGSTWIHLYVRDSNPASVFVVPKRTPAMEEGQDLLFECLVTDLSVTKLALRRDGPGGLPPSMVVTFDPQKGALIMNLKLEYRGHYVCSAEKDGREFTSTILNLQVVPKLLLPPLVSINQRVFIRVVGESLEMTCITTNPNHRYSVIWSHTNLQGLKEQPEQQQFKDNVLQKNVSVVLFSVQRHHSGGTFSCTAKNNAGNATETARLTVVDAPYLRVYLQSVQHANVSTPQMAGKLVMEACNNSSSGGANGSTVAEASVVEVWEGTDVTLSYLTEAYPPLRLHHWATPWQSNASHLETSSLKQDGLVSNLLLRRVRFEAWGNYRFFFSSLVCSGSQTILLRVYRPPHTMIKQTGNKTLTCFSSGYPRPSIHWYICPGVSPTCGDNATFQVSEANQSGETKELALLSNSDDVTVEKELALSFHSDDVTVECVARSEVGVSRETFVSYVTGHSRQQHKPVYYYSILIGASSTAFLLLLLLLLALLYKYKQKPRYEIRWKIIDSFQGNHYSFIDPTQLPYNDLEWEFPREQLHLGLVVGAGAFGEVLEATAFGLGDEESSMTVAVKMLKPCAHSEEREALMSELKILSHLGYHDNIVNLLGACTRGGPMLVITEYCYHGDLLNFLRGRASILDAEEGSAAYKNMEESSRFRSDSGISCSEYQEMTLLIHSHDSNTVQGQTDRICLRDLLQFSHQVAQGMDFLSSRNCIHRDLAARNVLLTEFRVAKICDFGLARDITHDDNYIIKGNARLPVKWMSPESIFQCVYTTQSDVWSYGVLLWEIFSMGKSPYPNVVVDSNFYKMIKDGRHMSQPDFATAEIYQLMIGCWNLEPTHRPTFTVIGQLIKTLLSTNETDTHQNDPCSDVDRQQGGGTEDQRLKSQTEDGPHQDIVEEAEPLRMKMMKNVYH